MKGSIVSCGLLINVISLAAQLASASKVSCDSCYLQKFVYSLINSVDNPLWLFEVLKQVFSEFFAVVVVFFCCLFVVFEHKKSN